MDEELEKVEFLDLNQVAKVLQLSVMTVKRYIKRKDNPLPAIYLSNQEIRIKKSDLMQWLESLPDPRQDV